MSDSQSVDLKPKCELARTLEDTSVLDGLLNKLTELRSARIRALYDLSPLFLKRQCLRILDASESKLQNGQNGQGDDDSRPHFRGALWKFLEKEDTPRRVLNIIGEGGAGKTTIMTLMESTIWTHLNPAKIGQTRQYIPLFMGPMTKHHMHMISTGATLREVMLMTLDNGLSLSDVELFESLKLIPVWMIDGFEGLGGGTQIHLDTNECEVCIVSSDLVFSETFLNGTFASCLKLKDEDVDSNKGSVYLEEVLISPFSEEEYTTSLHSAMLRLSREDGKESMHVIDAEQIISNLPFLKDVSKQPLYLSMVIEELPALMRQFPQFCDSGIVHMRRQALFTNAKSASMRFIKNLIERFFNRRIKSIVRHCIGWECDFEEWFYNQCSELLEDIAFSFYKKESSSGEKGMSLAEIEGIAQAIVPQFHQLPKMMLLTLPIRCIEKRANEICQFRISSQSLEYYMLTCRGLRLFRETLGERIFSQDMDLIRWFADRLVDNPKAQEYFKQNILESSKTMDDPAEDAKLVTSASNALSVLNYGGAIGLFDFTLTSVGDWRGIRVPFVNLSRAQLIECDFESADLSHSTLTQAYTYGTDLTKAKTEGMKTGLKGSKVLSEIGVGSITVNHNGSLLVAGSKKGSISVINTNTWKEVFANEEIMDAHEVNKEVKAIGFTPDEQSLVASFSDNSTEVWDIESRVCTNKFNSDQVYCLSTDCSLIASASNSSIRLVWVLTGETHVILESNTASNLNCMCISPDNKYLICSEHSESAQIDVWNLETSDFMDPLIGHVESAVCLSFSLDGKLLASGSEDCKIIIWNMSQMYNEVILLGHSSTVTSVTFHPSGNLVASGAEDRTLRIWDLKTARNIITFTDHEASLTQVIFTKDGQTLISVDEEKKVCNWDAPLFSCVPLTESHLGFITAMCFSPKGDVIASASDRIRLWDASTGFCLATFECHPYSNEIGMGKLCFTSDGTKLISCGTSSQIILWDVESQKMLKAMPDSWNTSYVSLSPDDQFIVSASGWKNASVWNIEAAEKVWTIDSQFSPRSVCFSPSGNVIATGSTQLELWDVKTKSRIALLDTHNLSFFKLQFSPNGLFLLGYSQNCAKLFDIESKSLVSSLDFGFSACFDAQGKVRVFFNGELFDIEGNKLGSFKDRGFVRGVQEICFHPSNSIVALATDSKTIELFENTTLKPIRIIGTL